LGEIVDPRIERIDLTLQTGTSGCQQQGDCHGTSFNHCLDFRTHWVPSVFW
jgi:hypothetical protein